jgi:integrase/recombinase XerD
MIAALQLSGKGERTQQAYVREVRLLAQFYGTSPDWLSEQELQTSFLHRQNVNGLAPASMRLCYRGIRCFAQHVLKRDWHTLTPMRAQPEPPLPAVLSVEEVRHLLNAATPLPTHGYCTTVYSLRLRLHAALDLPVSASDGQRMQVQVHRGKGAKDRYGPLPQDTVTLRRASGTTPCHPPCLLPATGRDQKHMATATEPMRRPRVQGAFRSMASRYNCRNGSMSGATTSTATIIRLASVGGDDALAQTCHVTGAWSRTGVIVYPDCLQLPSSWRAVASVSLSAGKKHSIRISCNVMS